MYKHTLDTGIEFLKGVGPERSEVLKKELGIFTFTDLLHHFPFRYIDRSKIHKISELTEDDSFVQLKGHITSIQVQGQKHQQRLTAIFTDGSGQISLTWFKGVRWIKPQLHEYKNILVFGRINSFQNKFYLPHPDFEDISVSQEISKNLQPVYSSTEKLTAKGLHSKGIHKLMLTLWNQVEKDIEESLPSYTISALKLLSKKEAYKSVHFPESIEAMKKAEFRLKFDELLRLQMQLLHSKSQQEKKSRGFLFSKVGDRVNQLYTNLLPYELTNAQKRVIKEIRKDLGSGIQMNRLLQGDVGSGKTIVALFTMLIALDNGFQASIMAPTEILAQQHVETFLPFFKALDIKYALLTGSTKSADRKIIFEGLASGDISIAIGTHALLENPVQFYNLGLVVIDEQHKFGVAQRAKLWDKNVRGAPHILVMTATPIPRTLALTFYGDLENSIIDELPPGRKPIKTVHQTEKNRLKVLGFLKNEINQGRQVYVVFPLIEESETLDYQNLMQGYENLLAYFPLPEYKIGVLHGRMKPADKALEMERFSQGKTHILIATTVIEVGVNVPNASIMVIESAEKFGLSQLHQLRGRVGRGAEQSFCFLMTGHKLSSDARIRLETMVRTNDGFEVAEADLKLRGPGDILGTQQSGMLDLKISNLATDGVIVALARDTAQQIVTKDPTLSNPEHLALKKWMEHWLQHQKNWRKIS